MRLSTKKSSAPSKDRNGSNVDNDCNVSNVAGVYNDANVPN